MLNLQLYDRLKGCFLLAVLLLPLLYAHQPILLQLSVFQNMEENSPRPSVETLVQRLTEHLLKANPANPLAYLAETVYFQKLHAEQGAPKPHAADTPHTVTKTVTVETPETPGKSPVPTEDDMDDTDESKINAPLGALLALLAPLADPVEVCVRARHGNDWVLVPATLGGGQCG